MCVMCAPSKGCFIADEGASDVWWRMFAIFIPLFVSWILTTIWYAIAMCRLRRLAASMRAPPAVRPPDTTAPATPTDVTVSGVAGVSSSNNSIDQTSNDLNEVRTKLILIPLAYILTVSLLLCIARLHASQPTRLVSQRVWGAVLRSIEIQYPVCHSHSHSPPIGRCDWRDVA